MNKYMKKLASACSAFRREEDGNMTVDFAFALPTAFLFAAATFETGMIGLRDVMLERGVDVTVREVRIGALPDPTHDALRTRICEAAMIIPDCENQLKLEMIRNDVRNYAEVDSQPDCVDRTATGEPMINWTNGGNNELMILRACSLFDPVLPTAKVGATLPKQSEGAYALVATSSFVLEPYK